jgi:hypothetical protein
VKSFNLLVVYEGVSLLFYALGVANARQQNAMATRFGRYL